MNDISAISDINKADGVRQATYYDGPMFHVFVDFPSGSIPIADGGLADWTGRLLSDRKERILTSGTGLSLLAKLLPVSR